MVAPAHSTPARPRCAPPRAWALPERAAPYRWRAHAPCTGRSLLLPGASTRSDACTGRPALNRGAGQRGEEGKVKSLVTAPAAGPVSAAVASVGRWPRGGAASGRQAAPGLGGVPSSASISPPHPPRRGALWLAALLAVRRLLALQPLRGFRRLRGRQLPLRSHPPWGAPTSTNGRCSLAHPTAPRGSGSGVQPAAPAAVGLLPPATRTVPVGRLRPLRILPNALGGPVHPSAPPGAPHATPPQGGHNDEGRSAAAREGGPRSA